MALLCEKIASASMPLSDGVIGGVGKSRRCITGSIGEGKSNISAAGRADMRRQSSAETNSGTSRYCFPCPIHRSMSPGSNAFDVRSMIGSRSAADMVNGVAQPVKEKKVGFIEEFIHWQ